MNGKLTQWLRLQVQSLDWTLLKGSTLVSIGTAIARVLGLAYSLVLAGVFPADQYGTVRYAIALASIVAIGAQPFGQHVMARFVSKYRNDTSKLDSILSNGFLILSLIFLGTLLIAVPVLLTLAHFNIGIIAIFFGETLFYAYWGLSAGFLEPRRFTISYLGSNLVQIILVYLVIVRMGIHSPTLALTIYGLSYLPPLSLLVVFWPFPGHVRASLINRRVLGELLHFALPIWVSHACYSVGISLDLLLLESWGTSSQLGSYSLSKTLTTMFLIVPMGISTLLMPKVASTPSSEHRRSLVRMLTVSLVVNAIVLAIYLPLVQPLTRRIFGADYVVAPAISILLALYMIAYGIHGLVTAVFVGSGRPHLESVSRIAELVSIVLGCWLLIPRLGATGAAIAMFVGKLVALLTYAALTVSGFSSVAERVPRISVRDAE